MRTLFLDRGGRAADAARALAGEVGADEALARVHRAIGPRARIWSVGRAGSTVEISWQFDRDADPEHLLAPLGLAGDWAVGRRCLGEVVGRPAELGQGPWSLAVRLDPDGTLTPRIGTTCWARQPDDDRKIARLTSWIAAHGGDDCYAGALYHLLLGAQRPPDDPATDPATDPAADPAADSAADLADGRPARSAGRRVAIPIGRAVEVDVVDGVVAAVHAYLTVRPPIPRPAEGNL